MSQLGAAALGIPFLVARPARDDRILRRDQVQRCVELERWWVSACTPTSLDLHAVIRPGPAGTVSMFAAARNPEQWPRRAYSLVPTDRQPASARVLAPTISRTQLRTDMELRAELRGDTSEHTVLFYRVVFTCAGDDQHRDVSILYDAAEHRERWPGRRTRHLATSEPDRFA